jgi:hypothetical protein
VFIEGVDKHEWGLSNRQHYFVFFMSLASLPLSTNFPPTMRVEPMRPPGHVALVPTPPIKFYFNYIFQYTFLVVHSLFNKNHLEHYRYNCPITHNTLVTSKIWCPFWKKIVIHLFRVSYTPKIGPITMWEIIDYTITIHTKNKIIFFTIWKP